MVYDSTPPCSETGDLAWDGSIQIPSLVDGDIHSEKHPLRHSEKSALLGIVWST